MKRARTAFLFGFSLAVVALASLAARNSSGTYSLPAGNPVTAGTTITTTWANTTLADISTELTNSLDRSGRGAMQAPLQCSNGTSSAPGLTFGSDPDSGLYRAGAGDIRMVVDATEVQKWTATTTTLPLGATLTQATTNAAAITATGNGTAAGVTSTGGSGGGSGVSGTGGATSGTGVIGTGGSTNGKGGAFTGTGTGVGVSGTGGTSNAAGGSFVGGVTNGHGVIATGTGTGYGVSAAGAYGIVATAAVSDGIWATGGPGEPGGRFTAGTTATASAPESALVLTNGYMNLQGTANPNSNVGFISKVTPKNIIKAWARFTLDSSTTPTLNDGFNISSVTVSGVNGTLTLVNPMTAGSYACTGSAQTSTLAYLVTIDSSAATVGFHLWGLASAGPSITQANMQTTTGPVLNIICVGSQ
jgi:hypothetical protein